jgi:hypothetical protein
MGPSNLEHLEMMSQIKQEHDWFDRESRGNVLVRQRTTLVCTCTSPFP